MGGIPEALTHRQRNSTSMEIVRTPDYYAPRGGNGGGGRGIGEGLLGGEAQVTQQLVVGIGFGVLGGEEFVAVEDRVGAGETAQGLGFAGQAGASGGQTDPGARERAKVISTTQAEETGTNLQIKAPPPLELGREHRFARLTNDECATD